MDKNSWLKLPTNSHISQVGSYLKPKSSKGFKYATKINWRYSNGAVAVMDPRRDLIRIFKIFELISYLA